MCRGSFLFYGDEKLYVRGVTYGTFEPDHQGRPFPDRETVRWDFTRMAHHGINTVRVYTAPPPWLLDEAFERGLWVLVGLAWQQHVAFLDDPKLTRQIETRMQAEVKSCAGHPSVLAYLVGNEIPAPIVR